MFSKSDISRNACQLFGAQARQGYDWWWHSFTAINNETGEEQPFFLEFFLCNPAIGGDSPVLGQLPENRKAGLKPSYLMVKVGAWGRNGCQLHRFFSWNETKVDMGVPYSVTAGDCFITETESRGCVSVSKADAEAHPEWMCDAGEISWNLKIDKKVPFNVGYGASGVMRKLQLFEMFWHAEGMKTLYSGEMIWNGTHYSVRPESSYGYADKNWGRNFTSPWVWLSSCNIRSAVTGKQLNNSVFDIGGGRPKVGPVALDRKLLSAVYYEGRCIEFNFSKFWTFTRTEFNCRETDTQIVWHVVQRNLTQKMVADFTCEKADMLLVNYESPDGEKRHKRLWNGGNGKGTLSIYEHGKLIDTLMAENVGCEWGEY